MTFKVKGRPNITLIGGTRPEAIKLAPIYHEMRKNDGCTVNFLSTGQHRQMLDATLACFDICPEIDLNLMLPKQSLPELSARVVSKVSEALDKLRPDAILVQGDTTTALFATIAAFYAKIPVGHVEAGLRTHNFNAPWPEEMNRRLISPIARWNFTPTEMARKNLLAEGIPQERIMVTGNTVIDALLWIIDRQKRETGESNDTALRCGIPPSLVNIYFDPNQKRRWVLVTGHRRESFGEGMEQLCAALLKLAAEYPGLAIIYPVHLNPNVREPVNRLLGGHDRIILVEPLDYIDFIWFMERCFFIITDSGGIQEEAPSLGKPVLVTRDTTERPEAVLAGVSTLVGTSPDRILAECRLLLDNGDVYAHRAARTNPYGDGHSSKRIVDRILSDLECAISHATG